MTVRIGINGFGRMGRLALRAAWGWPDLEFVHVNEVEGRQRDRRAPPDLRLGARTLGPRRVARAAGGVVDRRQRSSASAPTRRPAEVPWKERGVDVVLECSGKFRTAAQLDAVLRAAA